MGKNDPNKARITIARAPVHATDVYLGVHHKTIRTLASSGRLAAIGEYMGLIHDIGVLENPNAIFQGLNRPYMGSSVDISIYTYVTKPDRSYIFTAPGVYQGQGPSRIAAPLNSVFIAFVSFAKAVVDDVQATLTTPGDVIGGVIFYWEWTIAELVQRHAFTFRARARGDLAHPIEIPTIF